MRYVLEIKKIYPQSKGQDDTDVTLLLADLTEEEAIELLASLVRKKAS